MAILGEADRKTLLQVARDTIAHELYQYVALSVEPSLFSPPLRETRASFVTLEISHQLRGCIGTLEASRPLVVDVARNAGSAAFDDPRFSRLTPTEFDAIDIHVSILSSPEPVKFESEHDLLRQLRSGVDGLTLTEGTRRGTFLPVVWDQLPDPARFVQHLKLKAGLAADYWSDNIQIARYTTESFP